MTRTGGLVPIQLSVLLAAGLLVACDDSPMSCTASVEPAMVVSVEDSLDGSPVAAEATALAVDGAFGEALRPHGHNTVGELTSLAGPDERAGTYMVTVDKTGYAEWRQTDIRVTADECHVRTVNLTARLQRASGAALATP